MPIPLIAEAFAKGIGAIPFLPSVLWALPWLLLIGSMKLYFSGASNKSERLLHGKVVMITVGTGLSNLLQAC